MKKIVSVVGARPQFIKAAAVSRHIRKYLSEILVHTGQHYDENLSKIFFDDMDIPRPDYNLDVGSGSHGYQTGCIMENVEKVLMREKPAAVMVYGDTNTTLGSAIAAAKLTIPVFHVEAGLRSGNMKMPEEINRILTDKCSDLLFCPTENAVKNAAAEGITKGVYLTGDVMYDAALFFREKSGGCSKILDSLKLKPGSYILCTVHRAENTDNRDNMAEIVDALLEAPLPVVLPLHPRTKKMLNQYHLISKLKETKHIQIIDPVGYLDMIQLEINAKKIVTDSGGVQKEAYFYRVPCITLRNDTEWVETVEDRWNKLVGSNRERILEAIFHFSPDHSQNQFYGQGNSGEIISGFINDFLA